MKSIFKILFAPLFWIFQGCSPLGEPVNHEVSKNHYYNGSKSEVRYSPAGNWFELGNTLMQVDVKSFQALSNTLAKDKNHIYFEANRIEQTNIDVESFYTKPNLYMSNMGFDKNGAYVFETIYKDGKSFAEAFEIPKADPLTFEQFDFDWGKDANRYYYRYNAIKVDYDSFKNLNENYSSDTHKVFKHYNGHFSAIAADAATFKTWKGSLYGNDKNTLFYLSFSKTDKDSVELLNIPIEHGSEIILHNRNYVQNGDKIYFNAIELEAVDVKNFQIVSERYAKDAKYVYFENNIIQDADAATFEVAPEGPGIRDKNGRYRDGTLIADEK